MMMLRRVNMIFLYNIDWDLEKKQVNKILKALPDARLIQSPHDSFSDYQLWVPVDQFLIAWTLINYNCLMQKTSKSCRNFGLDCKNDCSQMYSESGLALYERNKHTVKYMLI